MGIPTPRLALYRPRSRSCSVRVTRPRPHGLIRDRGKDGVEGGVVEALAAPRPLGGVDAGRGVGGAGGAVGACGPDLAGTSVDGRWDAPGGRGGGVGGRSPVVI